MSNTRDHLPILYIVVPCYNEEAVLPETVARLSAVINRLVEEQSIGASSAILLVDDGSQDQTWALIERYFQSNALVKGLKLARNAGHQNALFAGLMHAKAYADAVISIDADLQDDVLAIPEMIYQYLAGYDVVYGVRDNRANDTWFKRVTAQTFYRLMRKLGANVVYNHADCRLLSRRVLEELARYEERNLFLRGIIPMIGFPATKVYYNRSPRFAGVSKYPFKKMLSFAFDGITSLSVTPIRLITVVGLLVFLVSIVVGCYALVRDLLGHAVTGWTSLMLSIWVIGGIQLMCLGLIGEYIAKIYKETKKRPKYHVETTLQDKSAATKATGDSNWVDMVGPS
ncbi:MULTISPECIES: glycosyltransferase family 2 protein [Alicyclobacillus]|uniref:Glycosyltransferase family 2 protein n=1 Tax=Alicyclobacillus acidoterrestris (strain ATCC 49025 / DSM 3922 / CIP 106132 / NCIMB 13137 / GD3B) TaxID=1356854 RepID=T0CQN8_ALIAG|nr:MULTISPECIES: glycosyltransferase family 2 protein [Alicyclobacillus]EPZ41792.1 bactoprenol glucosyl transferase [Alicyclobacillus acidoterrestris ATCC 49025]UNO49572.1 glycosyltransferase family 2 protein [Alicyclobacillus acidoterrestris]